MSSLEIPGKYLKASKQDQNDCSPTQLLAHPASPFHSNIETCSFSTSPPFSFAFLEDEKEMSDLLCIIH